MSSNPQSKIDEMLKYIPLSNKTYDYLDSEIRKTYQNACILYIKQIENKGLENQYREYVKTLENPNIKQLYHGTREKNAENIILNGFNPNYNNRSAYGNGIYFSTRAIYSKEYSIVSDDQVAILLVCDVALGKVGQGHRNEKIANEYDSATDNLEQPDMYIVDRKSAMIPRYLIAFYPFEK